MRQIKESGSQLLRTVNDLLDVSRLEEGRLQIEQIPFRMTDVLSSCCDLFLRKCVGRKIQLSIIPSPEVSRDYLGDPHRIKQIVCNYLSNAIKFTEDGGSIELRFEPWNAEQQAAHDEQQRRIDAQETQRQEETQQPESDRQQRQAQQRQQEHLEVCAAQQEAFKFEKPNGAYYRVSVTDTGRGIDKAKRRRLFTRFSQLNTSDSRTHGGSGLGLSICKELGMLMGGTVGCESVTEKGSTFWVILDLPSADTLSASMTRLHQEDEIGRVILGPRSALVQEIPNDSAILIADDSLTVQTILRRYLHKAGYINVTSCSDAIQAKRAFIDADTSGQPYRLIFLDKFMPGGNGPALLSEMRAMGCTAVVTLTTADPTDLQTARAMGFDAVLCKPFTYEEVRAVCASASASSPGSDITTDNNSTATTTHNTADINPTTTATRSTTDVHSDATTGEIPASLTPTTTISTPPGVTADAPSSQEMLTLDNPSEGGDDLPLGSN